ncbi:MAG: hypothetical protein N2Z65_07265, partial [Clostridiales bacterium]|nr:hypothetical protein [Clostridiales bacterium]
MAKSQVRRRKDVGSNFDIALDDSKSNGKTFSGHIDQPFVALTFLLLGTGLIMMFSAGYTDAYYNMHGNATYYIARQG